MNVLKIDFSKKSQMLSCFSHLTQIAFFPVACNTPKVFQKYKLLIVIHSFFTECQLCARHWG